MEKYIIAIVAVFIVGMILTKFLRGRGQEKKMSQFAEQRGWSFAHREDGLLSQYPELHPMRSDGQQNVRNSLTFNVDGHQGNSFDYSSTSRGSGTSGSSSNDTSTTTRYHVLGVYLPVPLPELDIRPRRRLDAIENKLTRPVSLDPEFDKAWTVHGEHQEATLAIMSPQQREYINGQDKKTRIVLQDNYLFTYRSGRQKLEDIDEMIGLLTGFLSRIPAEVWQASQAGAYPRPVRMRSTINIDLSKAADAAKNLFRKQ